MKLGLDRRRFLAFGSAAALLPTTAVGAPAALAAVRDQALAYVADGQAPSISVAVYHHGLPIWIEAFGWANRETQTAATTATRYGVASITKPFTATAIVSLLAQRGMSLDDPVEAHLGGITVQTDDGAPPVTFRELLQHRSGIPRHWRNLYRGQGDPPPFEAVARAHAFTTAARGQRYLYSNLNYGLLAAALEQITGSDFHDHLRETIFEPLGLASATTLRQQYETWSAAMPYEEDGTPVPPHLVDEKGARDLVMTAEDIARFGLAHLSGAPAITDGVRRLMLSERSPISTIEVAQPYYGLGWAIDEDSPAALYSFGHTGEGEGASASLTIVPGEHLVVATLANTPGEPAYRLNEMIVDAISPEFAARRVAHPYVEPEVDAGDLEAYAGNWSGEMTVPQGQVEVRVTIQGEENSTFAIAGAPPSPLSRLSVIDAVFSARSIAALPGVDADRWPHGTRLHLDRTSNGLDGSIAAFAYRAPPRLPHDQFWLSQRLRLSPA